MKILQIVKTSDGAVWAFNQASELFKHGVEVVTVLPNDTGVVAKKYVDSGMKIIIGDFSLPIKRPWLFWKKRKKLLSIIDSEKPDLIHFHFVTNILFGRIALRRVKIPRLFQVPGPLHLENIIIRRIEIGLANKYDYWAPACIFSKSIYEKYIDKNRIFLAYYGGYGGSSVQEYKCSDRLHKEFSISKEKKIIAMVSYFYKPKYYLGQLRGIKGHEDFIDAISILNKKYDNILAIVVGGPWGNSQRYEKKVEKYAKNKNVNNIVFTGFRNDIKKIYKEFDIAVHPSHSENLGGAAESLAAAVPTVATNVGGFPDIVIDGVTGFLCLPKNPSSLAKAIKKMLKNEKKARRLANEGQKRVNVLLDIKNTSSKILEIYNTILEK